MWYLILEDPEEDESMGRHWHMVEAHSTEAALQSIGGVRLHGEKVLVIEEPPAGQSYIVGFKYEKGQAA